MAHAATAHPSSAQPVEASFFVSIQESFLFSFASIVILLNRGYKMTIQVSPNSVKPGESSYG
jgi:hypothetical protein